MRNLLIVAVALFMNSTVFSGGLDQSQGKYFLSYEFSDNEWILALLLSLVLC